MESSEVRGGDAGGEQLEGSLCATSPSRKKQKDFVKRNIEVCKLTFWRMNPKIFVSGLKERI